MKKLLQLLLGVISHLLLTSTSLAQENAGTIYGSVLSESNEVIPLSTIALLQEDQIVAGIITDDQGKFILGSVLPGNYDLRISSVGYSAAFVRNVQVKENDVHIPPVRLKWGVRLSQVICQANRPFCNKPCGYGCICECCVPSIEFPTDLNTQMEAIHQVDTLSYLSLESWREKR